MTRAQQKKLDSIVGKIEALQSDISNGGQTTRKEAEAIAEAKKRLMEILSY